MPTVINAHTKNTHTNNCSHGKKPTRNIPTGTKAHMDKYTGNLSKGRGRPAHKADNLIAICESIF
jgi:hypothetical protein